MKITIEIDGQILDITEDLIDPESVKLSLPRGVEDLGGGRKRLTGKSEIHLSAKLDGLPRWEVAE